MSFPSYPDASIQCLSGEALFSVHRSFLCEKCPTLDSLLPPLGTPIPVIDLGDDTPVVKTLLEFVYDTSGYAAT